jgi:hypothetical protein
VGARGGTIAPVGCISVIAYEPCTCPDPQACPRRAAMNQVRDAIVAVMGAVLSVSLSTADGVRNTPPLYLRAGCDSTPA